MITDLSQEQLIRDLFARGEKEEGKQLLKEMISRIAKLRKFEHAEKLRELFIEIDPMALNDIIGTSEIIENEKIAAIDKNHLAVWSTLLETFGLYEFLTIYYSLEHKRFANGEIIVKQGSKHSALCFVNSGSVDLFLQENGKDVLVKTIGSGEIVGSDTFFQASTWTINARSRGAEVSFLKPDKLKMWQNDFPGLESKLNDFCSRFKIPYELFRRMGRDRRIFDRVPIDGKMDMALLDREGKDTGIGAKGELFDISVGGVSFSLRISQKKNARLLFGRNVSVTMTSTLASRFTITGVILAVCSQDTVGNEYSVSVQFSRVLAQKELKNLMPVHANNKK